MLLTFGRGVWQPVQRAPTDSVPAVVDAPSLWPRGARARRRVRHPIRRWRGRPSQRGRTVRRPRPAAAALGSSLLGPGSGSLTPPSADSVGERGPRRRHVVAADHHLGVEHESRRTSATVSEAPALPTVDSYGGGLQAAPRGASARAAGGAAVVLERLADLGARRRGARPDEAGGLPADAGGSVANTRPPPQSILAARAAPRAVVRRAGLGAARARRLVVGCRIAALDSAPRHGRRRAEPHRAGPSSGAPPSSTPHRSAAARSACTWHTSLRVSSSPGRHGAEQHPARHHRDWRTRRAVSGGPAPSLVLERGQAAPLGRRSRVAPFRA